jgi:hypothetical protein
MSTPGRLHRAGYTGPATPGRVLHAMHSRAGRSRSPRPSLRRQQAGSHALQRRAATAGPGQAAAAGRRAAEHQRTARTPAAARRCTKLASRTSPRSASAASCRAPAPRLSPSLRRPAGQCPRGSQAAAAALPYRRRTVVVAAGTRCGKRPRQGRGGRGAAVARAGH